MNFLELDAIRKRKETQNININVDEYNHDSIMIKNKNSMMIENKLMNWLIKSNIINIIMGNQYTKPTLLKEIESTIRDGSLFCIIIELFLLDKITTSTVSGWNKRPLTYSQCLSNVKKCIDSLRTCKNMNKKYLFQGVEILIVRGNWELCVSLLVDMYKIINNINNNNNNNVSSFFQLNEQESNVTFNLQNNLNPKFGNIYNSNINENEEEELNYHYKINANISVGSNFSIAPISTEKYIKKNLSFNNYDNAYNILYHTNIKEIIPCNNLNNDFEEILNNTKINNKDIIPNGIYNGSGITNINEIKTNNLLRAVSNSKLTNKKIFNNQVKSPVKSSLHINQKNGAWNPNLLKYNRATHHIHNKDMLDNAINNSLPSNSEKWLQKLEVKSSKASKKKIVKPPNVNIVTLEHYTPDVFSIKNQSIQKSHYDEIFSESTQ